MPTLLVIDDEPLIRNLCLGYFQSEHTEVLTAAGGAEGLEVFCRARPDAVLLDLRLPDQSGLEAFQKLREIDPTVPVIIFTGYGSTESAIQAMACGAHDYVLKPFSLEKLEATILRAFEISRLARAAFEVEVEPSSEAVAEGEESLVGRSPTMQEVYKSIGRVAPQPVTALLLGESGTGKELVARAIDRHSRKARASRAGRTGPFLAVNCAAIPENLLESELFGHEKGSFTGADRRRVGKFEQATGGTLFLDEVGDMTSLTQSKLLRVLQEQAFERVGGSETIRTDVRIIAATNRDLKRMVERGQFRQDLYYRLNVFAIRLPPLRERLEDLPLLIAHFLRRYRSELGKGAQAVAPEALDLLHRHPWPGNVRELQSALKHAMLRATGSLLLPEHFASVLERQEEQPASPPSTGELERFVEERLQAGSQNLYEEWRDRTDGWLLAQVLRATGGNLSQAARVLGIHRSTLRGRVQALGLKSQETQAGEEAAAG